MLDFIYLKIKCNGTSKQSVIYLFSYLSWVGYLGQLGWIRPWVSRSPTPKRSIGGWGNKLRAYSAEVVIVRSISVALKQFNRVVRCQSQTSLFTFIVSMNRLNTEKLISLVSNYPLLYDAKHRDYGDLHKRDAIWQQIAGEMSVKGR